jgi:hypothetical protein
VVLCGDFNNLINHFYQQMTFLGFERAMDIRTITYKFGGHLDQKFARGVGITDASVKYSFDHEVTDRKCLKVSLDLKLL